MDAYIHTYVLVQGHIHFYKLVYTRIPQLCLSVIILLQLHSSIYILYYYYYVNYYFRPERRSRH